jgi:type IV pilus assembly protein PilX
MIRYKKINREQGAVLIVGLIMLLLLTIIGLASIRGSDLQERMAGNMRDRNLAFQAAEAGLRRGEDTAMNRNGLTKPASINTSGYWDDLNKPFTASPGRPTAWDDDGWTANSKKVANGTLEGLADQPSYAIEQLLVPPDLAGEGSHVGFASQLEMTPTTFYRVTSRGLGGTVSSEVILQSTIR